MTFTKQQAISEFREVVGNSYRGDNIAKREAWLNYVDALCADHIINQTQRDNWTNPF